MIDHDVCLQFRLRHGRTSYLAAKDLFVVVTKAGGSTSDLPRGQRKLWRNSGHQYGMALL
jgi:hypothetical protein